MSNLQARLIEKIIQCLHDSTIPLSASDLGIPLTLRGPKAWGD
jgi:hypothetical protein